MIHDTSMWRAAAVAASSAGASEGASESADAALSHCAAPSMVLWPKQCELTVANTQCEPRIWHTYTQRLVININFK